MDAQSVGSVGGVAGSIGGTTSATDTTKTGTTTPGGALGKNEFLNLLMTQMRNQDPLDPMDSTATIAQLAQFSSLEQMSNLNKSFEGYRQQDALIQSLLLKGKNVQAQLNSGTTVSGVIQNVTWGSDGMSLTINDVPHALTSLTSLSLVDPVGTIGGMIPAKTVQTVE